MKYFKKQPCPNCGTRSYKKSSEGYYVCRYGHQMMGWQEEEGEETGVASSRLKRKKVRKVQIQDNGRLYGVERLSAFYRIFQLGLQAIASACVHDLGLPSEFENVTREFWLLYVSNSNMELSDAYTVAEDPHDTQQRRIKHADADDLEEDDLADLDDLEELKALTAPENIGKDTRKPTQWPVLRFHHTLVFCYLACIWLKWPVMLSDIRRWCVTLQLPYLKILKRLPDDLVARLDKRSLKHMLHVPTMADLQLAVNTFVHVYEDRCDLVFPKANIPLLMHRCCTQFFLPVGMYFCALRLYDVCQQSHHILRAFHHTRGDEKSHHTVDMRIMLTVLVIVKLCYVLDDQPLDTIMEPESQVHLLPKSVWLERVRANTARWQALYDKEEVESPDVDLWLLLDYLDGCAPRDLSYVGQQKAKNRLRSTMNRLARDMSATQTRPVSEADPGLFMRPPESALGGAPSSASAGQSTGTRSMGEAYVRHNLQAKSQGKVLHHKEYELILTLAAHILNVDVEALHSSLTHYELLLQDALKSHAESAETKTNSAYSS